MIIEDPKYWDDRPLIYPLTHMRKLWIDRMLALADHISSWSKDPSTKVGAVIADPYKKTVLGMGYNGFPRKVVDDDGRYSDREQKYAMVVHAEVNAILNAVTSVRSGVLFCTYPPCSECAKYIIQAGIRHVIAYKVLDERWRKSFETTKIMCTEAGVDIFLWAKPPQFQSQLHKAWDLAKEGGDRTVQKETSPNK